MDTASAKRRTPNLTNNILNAINQYVTLHPHAPREPAALVFESLACGKDITDPGNFTGHVVVEPVVVAADKGQVFTVEDRHWRLPSGHLDPTVDTTLRDAAIRILARNIGILPLAQAPAGHRNTPIDMRTVVTPATLTEPAHMHVSISVLFVAATAMRPTRPTMPYSWRPSQHLDDSRKRLRDKLSRLGMVAPPYRITDSPPRGAVGIARP